MRFEEMEAIGCPVARRGRNHQLGRCEEGNGRSEFVVCN
jgi:hypothetical protein